MKIAWATGLLVTQPVCDGMSVLGYGYGTGVRKGHAPASCRKDAFAESHTKSTGVPIPMLTAEAYNDQDIQVASIVGGRSRSYFMVLQPARTDGDTQWFVNDRFGLFIHWGLYAMGARHEWMKSAERMDTETYDGRYFKRFDPDLYDPDLWAKAAAGAGMKYFVVTTKHHEGFCLWDSKLTDYKATNTPAGRDLLRPMVDAFRSQGMRVGFYHSLLDWHHPDYTVDVHHPMQGRPEYIAADKDRDVRRYAEYLHGQTRELLTGFGDVDILWYDFSIPATDKFAGKGKEVWQSEELIRTIRSLQPRIILNDRLEIDQDVKTPEQYQPREWVTVGGQPVVWEACQSFIGSWGYHRDEESWKSGDMLVKMLVDSVRRPRDGTRAISTPTRRALIW